jgi:hypothetical protein
MMEVREVTAEDAYVPGAFFRGLPAGDRTFFWSDVTDPAVALRWAGDPSRIRRCAVDDEAAIAMFQGIGFDSEALLRDHLRKPDDGRLRDLVVLAHLVDERYATMQAAGLGEIAR